MASIADLIYVPIFAIIIFSLAVFGMALAPQASADFKKVTNTGISETLVQTSISTLFKERNAEGVENFKAISYRLCSSPSATNNVLTDLESSQPRGISEVVDYMNIDFNNIPSQCTSASSFTEMDLFGVSTPTKRTYAYEKKIPVIGGDVVDMEVNYEVE